MAQTEERVETYSDIPKMSETNGSCDCFLVCRRVRDKYEAELTELERSERNMQDKYNSMKV